jgi:hypothetical protein
MLSPISEQRETLFAANAEERMPICMAIKVHDPQRPATL